MSDDNLYLVMSDLMDHYLMISIEDNSVTAHVNFEEPDLIFNIHDLCILKKWLAEAIFLIRPRLKNVVVTPRPYEINGDPELYPLNWTKLSIKPFINSAVYMSLENLMCSRRYITDCIVKMMLNKKKEKVYLKKLREVDNLPPRPSSCCWGGY